jgi:class 3 adenylate cyclase
VLAQRRVTCMWRLSTRSKIIIVLLMTGLGCLAIGGVISYQLGNRALTRSIEQRLTAQRELKRQRVDSYVQNELRFTAAVGSAPETVEATKGFIAAFHAMRPAVIADPAAEKADLATLDAWYRDKFVPRLDRITGGHQQIDALMPSDPVARRLQADYIARNPNPPGQKNKLAAAPGDSAYDIAHAQFHPLMKRIADTVGFYDINLLDAQTGDVVYTVAKETDFASNMYQGPYERSGFARAAQRALDPRNGGDPVVEDYTPYTPSGFAPQMFTAVPVVADGQTIGVFVAQIDIKTLNNLINDNGQWQDTGQGKTGEVLLVGQDRLLRSESRFMTEAPEKFLAEAKAAGLSPTTANQIAALSTTILYMPETTEAIQLAFRNQSGLARYADYRGVPVIAAYGPLDVAGLHWAIAAKQDLAEALAPEVRLRNSLLTAAAAVAVVLTFLALGCAAAFTRPLKRILAGMASIRDGGVIERVPVRGEDEFTDLARGYNAMADAIDARDQHLAAAEGEKTALLRSIYPEGFAERMRVGAESTAETISNVTVAVAWIEGLQPPGLELSATELRDRLDILLETLNTAASAHGVEPVRSLGESYIVVCGLSSPRLDHAARTLAWTRSASLAVARIGDAWARTISLRFGLASGEIDVLLLSNSRSAYDLWGRTIGVARLIAVEAKPGTVCVADNTYRLLTDVEGLEPSPPIENRAWGTITIWTSPVLGPAMGKAAE